MRVTSAWQRIDAWLAEHAPATARVLNPPAPRDRIGAHLPAELVASLLCHDGADADELTANQILPPLYYPLSIEGIDHATRAAVDLPDWRPGRVVLAEDGLGSLLYLDPDVGLREYDVERGPVAVAAAGLLVELLEVTADALDGTGALLAHYVPGVNRDGALEWELA